jgi:hypothetical protein
MDKPVDVQNQKQSQRRIVECTYEVRACTYGLLTCGCTCTSNLLSKKVYGLSTKKLSL